MQKSFEKESPKKTQSLNLKRPQKTTEKDPSKGS